MDAKSKANFINSVGSGQKVPCPNCNTLNDSDALFCASCGTKLGVNTGEQGNTGGVNNVPKVDGVLCTKCNTMNEPGAVFCESCGVKLGDTSVSEQVAASLVMETSKDANSSDVPPNSGAAFAPAKKGEEKNNKERKVNSPMNQTQQKSTSEGAAFRPVSQVVHEEPEEVSAFAQGLPDWDIVPPQVMVRRKKK